MSRLDLFSRSDNKLHRATSKQEDDCEESEEKMATSVGTKDGRVAHDRKRMAHWQLRSGSKQTPTTATGGESSVVAATCPDMTPQLLPLPI